MLEYIRSSAQSFGVKVAFGIIILVFVFWGIGNFNDRDYSNVVAVVNGEPILAQEFERAYRNAEEYILSNNPGASREMLIKEHLGRRVLNDLIRMTLMSQEAAKNGIEVTPLELRVAAGQMKAFQDDKGNFDPVAYKNILAAQRMTPAQYEKELGDQLLRDKLYNLVATSVWIDPDEARNRYNFLREQRVIDYIFIPAADFAAKADVGDTDVKNWYDSHLQDFAVPPRVDISYIAVRPQDLVDATKIDEQTARAWYEANKSRFAISEQVHARHILIPVAPDADEQALAEAKGKLEKAKNEIESGKPFAAVADLYNSAQAAGKGGDLGWVLRGQTLPQFEEAAFALAVGEMSGEVRTPYGLHLILVEEKIPEGVRPFEEVADEARKGVAFDEGSDKLHDALDNLIEDNILQKPLAESAARYGLKVEQSGLLDQQQLMQKLGIKAEGASALLDTPAGAPLDTVLDAGDSYIIARVDKSEAASTRPFKDVEQQIKADLMAEKALAQAMAAAKELLAKVGNMTAAQIKAENIALHTGINVDRAGAIGDFLPDPALNEAIFNADPPQWLGEAYSEKNPSGSGALIVRVDKVTPPAPEEFAGIEEIMVNGVRRERMDALFDVFMQKLMDNAEVKVLNTNLVDRVNM